MNVLSFFDGISCGQQALVNNGVQIDNYFSCEIEKNSIIITQKNHKNTIQLGDVNNINIDDLPQIDLFIGGSPCQGFSFAGKKLAFDDIRSKLYFKFEETLNKLKSRNNNLIFLLENVAMEKKNEDIITNRLGYKPVHIDSSLFSAQRRQRLYWSNRTIKDNVKMNNSVVKDILIDEKYVDEKYYIKTKHKLHIKSAYNNQIGYLKNNSQGYRVYNINKKSAPVLALGGGLGAKSGLYLINNRIRRLMPIECERLQTLPDNYTEGISDSGRYKALGNGWTVSVISHIFKNILMDI